VRRCVFQGRKAPSADDEHARGTWNRIE
jgi:hypothetical protein